MKRKKRSITLLEIMIVVLLIGIIGSVLGYNMKGSLDEGRAFKSREGAKQIHDILILQAGEGVELATLAGNPRHYLMSSGLVANIDSLLKDGWGKEYEFKVENDDLTVYSAALNAYEENKRQKQVKSAPSSAVKP